ncbi:alpha-L-arabinofuranosidase C-terminal domain-containing protein [Actinomyces sp.]|uniref:alpha-L-arabinofuranosidase C-terminal domain-containing protein n=1 Tax=Actinomyces sp. TaxID=29317 RepID=UPI0026DC1B07|nr:alpha-L-arabinofuranosidase C-terminal domain-containing protein [Actinomyces sp.]MDO4901924.1 alpha-L-arabinofuranosidase C-terminal domain-containing protein [Actinomyces sp.]
MGRPRRPTSSPTCGLEGVSPSSTVDGRRPCQRAEPGPYQAISLHSYTFTDSFETKGQARGFGTDAWYSVFANAWWMEELITRHSTVMDRYDPFRRVGLVVDEWGAWWEVRPGTNPHFLEQDNALRDALIASLHFDIFHRHAERVIMANLAQTVNVLQAPILTDPTTGAMVLTPTYHVLAMNTGHHDATRLDVRWVNEPPVHANNDVRSFSLVSVSASRKRGAALISATNLDADAAHTVRLDLRGAPVRVARAKVLTADALDAHNTPEAPDVVVPVTFSDWSLTGGVLEMSLPRAAYVAVSLELSTQSQ